MLVLIDQWEKNSREDREMRLALVAGGHRTPEEMFPERFGQAAETTPQEAFEDPEAALDFSEVIYESVSEEAYEEYERLLFAGDESTVEEAVPDTEWV